MRRLLLTFLFAGLTLAGFPQDEKFSVSTQIFLNQQSGKFSSDVEIKTKENQSVSGVQLRHRRGSDKGRFVASPDTIDGKAYISAFLRLKDNNDLEAIKALGVEVQCKFDKGLVTVNIPVDKINELATIDNVKRISVATLMRPLTDEARRQTNVDDVLTHSTDAITAGLKSKYDGSGVLLGVIDTGIDFQHIAFKDKNGNSRIKRAYIYNGTSASEYKTITSTSPTTDNSSQDHGTHTCSTAGGSSVVISGSSVTVTDDHANATYGGMAPGADLYLCGLNKLSDTYVSNSFQKICNYAESTGQPLVVSNSWGSQIGPHDGTGAYADLMAQYFEGKKNRVCLFAASNDGGSSKDNEGGGYHLRKTVSSTNPIQSILRSNFYIDADAGYYYDGAIANIWTRSPYSKNLICKIYVLDAETGEKLDEKSVTPTTNGASVDVSSYFSGSLYALKNYITSSMGKAQVMLYADGLKTKQSTKTTRDGSTYYVSKYTLAFEIAPESGSVEIDIWGGGDCYFTNHLTTSGYNWIAGNDDMCVSDEATIPNVISVGAYVSKNSVTDLNGTPHSIYSTTPDLGVLGDIAGFSSYATAEESPTGLQYPWITAPGADLVAGVNAYHTSNGFVDNYLAQYGGYRVNNNKTYPYGNMHGTSMATPAAAGIVALWFQAAKEVGLDLTLSDVKNIMKETAIKDDFTTTGANASHFGNGKINALAGIKYILGVTGDPKITVSPASVDMSGIVNEGPYTETVSVTGTNLEENITATLTDANNVFSIDKATINQRNGDAQADITISWNPTVQGTQTATLTLSSGDAEPVTVNLKGTATEKLPDEFPVVIGRYGLTTLYLNYPVEIPFDTYDDILGVYYAYEVTPSEVKMARVRSVIPAYTGVVVQGNSNDADHPYLFPRFMGEVVPSLPTSQSFLSGSIFEITPKEALELAGASSKAKLMVLGPGTGSNGYIGFYEYSGKKLAANKAFLIIDSDDDNSSVNTLSVDGLSSEFTGISEVNANKGNGAWFTPQGVRLNGTPKQGGLYIHNGKTVVVK